MRHDAQLTRSKLFQAAEAVFIERGFDAARVDEIAARAHINKRMIYAYFGNKNALYMEVLRENVRRFVEIEDKAIDWQQGGRVLAEVIIRRYFEFLATHPGFVRLLGMEVANGGRHAGAVLLEVNEQGLGKLNEVLQRGVAEGVFRADVDIRYLIVNVNSMCIGFFQRRAMLENLWQCNFALAEAQEQVLKHILSLVFDGLCVHSQVGEKTHE